MFTTGAPEDGRSERRSVGREGGVQPALLGSGTKSSPTENNSAMLSHDGVCLNLIADPREATVDSDMRQVVQMTPPPLYQETPLRPHPVSHVHI